MVWNAPTVRSHPCLVVAEDYAERAGAFARLGARLLVEQPPAMASNEGCLVLCPGTKALSWGDQNPTRRIGNSRTARPGRGETAPRDRFEGLPLATGSDSRGAETAAKPRRAMAHVTWASTESVFRSSATQTGSVVPESRIAPAQRRLWTSTSNGTISATGDPRRGQDSNPCLGGVQVDRTLKRETPVKPDRPTGIEAKVDQVGWSCLPARLDGDGVEVRERLPEEASQRFVDSALECGPTLCDVFAKSSPVRPLDQKVAADHFRVRHRGSGRPEPKEHEVLPSESPRRRPSSTGCHRNVARGLAAESAS